jgi:anti-sigma28 factor (negative regulator of flagellin synthesis)
MGVKFDIFSQRSSRQWYAGCLRRSISRGDERCGLPPADTSEGVDVSADEKRGAEHPSALDEMTETREERIARLRAQVRSGTYEIPVPHLVRILADFFLRRR